MLDILFVALLQAAAGEPTTPPAPTGEATDQTQETSEGATDSRDTVRCRRVEQIGSRLGSRLVCSTPRQDQEQHDNAQRLHDRMTRSVPPEPIPGMGPG
jgi:hypothetical protein